MQQLRKHRWHHLWALLVVFCMLPLMASADAKLDALQVKAALVFKLTPFVTWPDNQKFAQSTFDICLLGKDDIGSALEKLEIQQADGKPVKLLRFTQSDAVSQSCRILFIGQSREPFLDDIFRNLASHNTLTISDIPGFALQGGMIELTTGKRIGFEINLAATRKANLNLAAPLLQLSSVINQ